MAKVDLEMPQINLVGKKGALIDTFLHWALTTGRFIIIVTETVALAVFVLRFSLDSQIIDLHDKIREKQAIVDLFKHNEDTYRNLQDRLTMVQTLDTKSQEQTQMFFSLLNTMPDSIQLNSFTFLQDSLHLDINTNSTATLSQFIQNLTAQKHISGISIDHIENRVASGTIEVALTANIK
jgi:Tfp pilus assembly protein PilN